MLKFGYPVRQIRAFVFLRKSFYDTYYVKELGRNLIGLDWIGAQGLFSKPINTVFNTVAFPTVYEFENHFALSLKTKLANVFKENLQCLTKIKATRKAKPDVISIFKPKYPVPYATLDLIEMY